MTQPDHAEIIAAAERSVAASNLRRQQLDAQQQVVEGALRTAVALNISMTTILIDMLTADIRRLP